MEDKEIVQKIEQGVKESENWSVYHHLKDKLGYPTYDLLIEDIKALLKVR